MSVVAIEYDINDNTIMRYYDNSKIAIDIHHEWVINKNIPYSPKGVLTTKKLKGEHELKYMTFYRNDEAFRKVSGAVRGQGGIVYFDPIQQYLAIKPQYKLFEGMKYEQLKRVAIDIETTGLDPEVDCLLMCGVANEQKESDIFYGSEADIIRKLNEYINWYNPDVIEGWNIYGFDIPFLEARAKVLGLELKWGRNGDTIYKEKTKQFRVGSYSMTINYYRCWGRHVLDGMLIAMRFDTNVGGKFESYSLKHVAKALGVQEEDRLILERSTLEEQWNEHPETVMTYCRQDCLETISIMNIIAQPDFYLTSILPDSFQHITVSGGATKINQLLVTEYIGACESIPAPLTEREEYEGGYVELRNAGVFHNTGKVDVSSLYPSIMLNFNVVPPQDTLGVFKNKLQSLTNERLRLKKLKKNASLEEDKIYYQGMEKAYKVVINSFYGYLGTTGMNFADFNSAGMVTSIGRDIVCDMAEQLEAMGLVVIEIDTDGIYFQYPDGFPIDAIPFTMILPEGINVDMDEPYKCMVAVKAKNYVLVTDKEIKYHGNSLRSRKDEKFGQEFLKDVIDNLISGRIDQIYDRYHNYQSLILNREIDIKDLVARERVSDKTFTSSMKKRLAEAASAADATEGDYIYTYNREDGSLGLEEQYDSDENRFYYLERLYKFAQRIQPVLDIYGVELARMDKRTFTKQTTQDF